MGFFRNILKNSLAKDVVSIARSAAGFLLYGILRETLDDVIENEKIFPLGGSIFGRRHFLYITDEPHPWDGYTRSTMLAKTSFSDNSDVGVNFIYVWFNSMPKRKYRKEYKNKDRVVSIDL